MKKYLNRDVFLILLGNLFTEHSLIIPFLVVWYIMFGISENIIGFILCFLTLIFLFLLRLMSLPLLYFYLERNTKHDIVKIFIHKLKTSWLVKFLVLLLSLIPTIINIFYLDRRFFFDSSFFGIALLLGLFGSYLILFLYWFIVDIIKHIKEQR